MVLQPTDTARNRAASQRFFPPSSISIVKLLFGASVTQRDPDENFSSSTTRAEAEVRNTKEHK